MMAITTKSSISVKALRRRLMRRSLFLNEKDKKVSTGPS